MQTQALERSLKKNYREPVWISEDSKLDLKKIFPPSKRFALRHSLIWFIASAILSTIAFVLFFLNVEIFGDESGFALATVTGCMLLAAVCVYIYAKIYASRMKYNINGYRLIVKRGVIFTKTGSVPIAGFHETYVYQGMLDVLCGVYTFRHLVWFDKGAKLTCIEGLSKKSAYGLQKLISDLQSRQVAFFDNIKLNNPIKEHLIN